MTVIADPHGRYRTVADWSDERADAMEFQHLQNAVRVARGLIKIDRHDYLLLLTGPHILYVDENGAVHDHRPELAAEITA